MEGIPGRPALGADERADNDLPSQNETESREGTAATRMGQRPFTTGPATGHQPLCGDGDELAPHTQAPALMAGCEERVALVAGDLADHKEHRGRCLHCHREITALGGVACRHLRNRTQP